jgi:hypothetical protein
MLVGFWDCVEEKYTDNGLRGLAHGAYYIAHSSKATSRRREPSVDVGGTPLKKRRKIYNNNVLAASSLNSCKCQRRAPIHSHTCKQDGHQRRIILYGILLNSCIKEYNSNNSSQTKFYSFLHLCFYDVYRSLNNAQLATQYSRFV